MNRLQSPRLYNQPQFVTTTAALAAGGSYAFIDPVENHNGRFLASVSAWAYRAVSEAPALALLLSRKSPSGFSDSTAAYLAFSLFGPYGYTSPDDTFYAAVLQFRPEALYFVPPGYGLYIAARNTPAAMIATAEIYFDVEQAGR